MWQQYLHYIWGVMHGDLGISLKSRLPVWDEFVPRFKATLELGICAMILPLRWVSLSGCWLPLNVALFLTIPPWAGADRLLHADLLVGHDADYAGLGAA